jgi:hypothetical protein
VYKLSKKAVLEIFNDGGLILILPESCILELNSSAVAIISLLDGERTLEQVAVEITKSHDISHNYPVTRIIQDVLELCIELKRIGILEFQADL